MDAQVTLQIRQILEEELLPAMGCTEPISIAYAAARARQLLGREPERLLVEVSGNILKNVKSVVVPHTGGLRGIRAAALAGALIGDPEAGLEVLSRVSEEQIASLTPALERVAIEVRFADTPHIFDIMISAFSGKESAFVRIAEHHTNLVCLRRNGETLLEKPLDEPRESETDRSVLRVERIVDYAALEDLEAVRPLLERQIAYNMAIAEEGLNNSYDVVETVSVSMWAASCAQTRVAVTVLRSSAQV